MTNNTKKSKRSNNWKFDGFTFPTTTPVPDQVFDELLYYLSPTEIVVLLYIIRRTFGFKKRSDNISLKQLCEGIITNDGRILDRGTGLSKATVARVLKSLEEKNIINRKRRRSKKRGDQPTTYELNFITPVSQNKTGGVSEMKQGVSQGRDTQQTVLQQTDYVVERMIELKITPRVAKQLASEYPIDHLKQKISLVDYLTETNSSLVSRNPAGYLRKAITEDYQPPKGFTTGPELEAKAKEDDRQKRQLDGQERAVQENEKVFRSQLVDAYQTADLDLSVWELALEHLQHHFSRQFFDTWLKDTFLHTLENGVATIGVANNFAQDELTNKAQDEVSEVLSDFFGEQVAVRFNVLGFD